MPGNFFDTNILVYLAVDPQRASRVRELVDQGGTISVQVLNELANVARKKMGYSWQRTNLLLAGIRVLLPVIPVTVAIHEAGVVLAERYRFAVYDAMIVAAALASGCDTLWSEDMQDGLVIDGRLTVINPFRAR